MQLSNRYNFLFVHIAKTGGTSMRAALRRLQWRDPLYWPQWLCARIDHATGHRIAAKLPRHAPVVTAQHMLPAEVFSRLFKFAFVRNPWDLQVSSWHHLRRERPRLLEGLDSFDDFIRYKLDPERPAQFHLDVSIRSQREYLVDLNDRIIVDYIGRYENLADDYRTIAERLGVRLPALPEKRRAKDREDYRCYYSNALAELVGEAFKRDVETFGYCFDGDAQQQRAGQR
jgi:hypothetical protein